MFSERLDALYDQWSVDHMAYVYVIRTFGPVVAEKGNSGVPDRTFYRSRQDAICRAQAIEADVVKVLVVPEDKAAAADVSGGYRVVWTS